MSKNNNGGPTQGDLQFMQLFGKQNVSGPSIGIDYAARGISPYREALGKYDTGLSPALYESGYERNPVLAQQYLRASNQSGGKQLWNGFWSRTASIVPKVGQGVGHVLGFGSSVLKGGINSWDPSEWKIEDTYDNAIVKAFQELDEGLKETLPVYQSKAYTEGNWVQKMFTTSFWATDGFDGLAFLASAYVPGAAIGKLGKITTALRSLEKSKRALNFAKKLESFTDFTGIDSKLAVSTLYNTVSEAGFEAAEVNAVMREEFARQMGFDSYEQAKEDPEADAIIRDKAGASAARTFAWNSAALLAPNFFQSKWLHGKPVNHSRELQLKYRRDPNVAKAATRSKMDYAKGFGKGVLSEGLWEENIQTSVAAYEERLAKGQQDDGAIVGPVANLLKNAWSFGKTVGTLGLLGPDAGTMEDEAGSAILLGALMGGGMSIASTYLEGKRERDFLAQESKQWKDLRSYNDAAKRLLVEDFKSPYEPVSVTTDENGKEVAKFTDTANPNGKLNADKMAALGFRHGTDSIFFGEAMTAEGKADANHTEFNKNMSLAAYAWRLATSTLSSENAKDLLEFDNTLNEEYAMEEFGEGNLVADNKQKISEMIDMFYQTRQEIRGTEDSSDSKFDQAFDTMMVRNGFYLKTKRKAVEAIQTTTEKQAEEKQALLDDIDAKYKSLQNDRKTLKKDFMRQVDPLSSFNEKLIKLEQQLEKGEITKAQYNKQANALQYMMNEAKEMYGTRILDYDTNSGLGVSEFVTMDNESIHNKDNVSEPRNPIQKLLYNVGFTTLVEEEIQRNAIPATEDMASSTEFAKSLNKAKLNTPTIDSAVRSVQDQYKNKVQEAEALRSELESVEFDDNPTTDADAMYLISDGEGGISPLIAEYAPMLGIDEARLQAGLSSPLALYNELALAQEQQIQALNNEIQQLNTQLSEINDAYGKLQQRDNLTKEQKDLLYMAEQSYREGDKEAAHKFLVEYHLDQLINKVDKIVEDFEKAPDQFLKEDEVNFLINQLVQADNAFDLRTDIDNDSFIEYSRAVIAEALGRLGVLSEQIKENKNNRFAKQQFTIAQQLSELQSLLHLDSNGIPTPSSPLYQTLLDAFGNHDKITKVFQAARRADGILSVKAVNTIIQFATTKATSKTKLDTMNNLKSWQKEYIKALKAVRPKAWIANLEAIASNPNKYGPYMLQVAMDMYEQFQDASTPFYRFTKHKDLATLKFELARTKNDEGVYAGMDLETSKQLDEVLEHLSNLKGATSALAMVQGEFDVFTAFEEEVAITEELGNGDVQIAPTAQQFSAVQQLLSFVTSKFNKGPMGRVSVLQGVLGAGKSLVGMKYVVRILKKLMNLSDANIVAFGHNAYSSEVIASSVYDDPNNGGTMEDFLERTDIKQVKLVILDEAMAMTNADIETVYKKIEDENATRPKAEDKIKVIALGDASQITVEPVQNTALGSLDNYATKDTSSLSVVYRTNVNSIIDVINAFKDKPDPQVSLNTTASHTLSDLKAMPTTNEAFGVQGGSLEDLVSLVNKPSDKSRVIIVNNETSAKRVRERLNNDNVDVVVYFDAQSRQWDQVYIYMDQGMNRFDGTPFLSTLEYNAAMYTMVGRAKQFVFLANPSLNVNVPIVDTEIASKVEDNTDEFTKNSSLYGQELDATQAVLEEIDSSRATKIERTPAEKIEEDETLRETIPEEREVEHEELLDDELTEDEKTHEDTPIESEVENEEQELLTPPTQQLTDLPPKEKGQAAPFRHSFANPTNSLTYPTSINDSSQDIDPTKPGQLIVDSAGTVHLVQAKGDRYYHLAIIGDRELNEDGFAGMKDLIETSEKIDANQVDTSSRGFTIPEDIDPVIGTVNFERLHGLRYQLQNTLNNAVNTLGSVISKWYDGFFNEAAGGRGVLPDTDFFNEDGSINWGSNKFMVQIFNDRQIREMQARGASYNSRFKPKKGIPYLIIKNPATKSTTSEDPTAVDQFIRLEPKRLTRDNKWVNTLAGYASLAESLKEYGLNIGTPTFTKVMKLWRRRLIPNEGTTNVEINSDVSAFDLLTEVEELGPLMQNLSEDDITALVQLLDQMATKFLYGTKKGALRYTEAEAKELVKNNPEAYHSIEATKNLGERTSDAKVWVVYIKDSDGSRAGVLTGNNISTVTGPAQVALNILSNANQKMGDVRVRVTSGAAARSYTKSLMSGSEANSQYYKWKQSTLKQFVDDLFSNYPDILADIPKSALTGANEDGAISTSKMEDILTAFMAEVINGEGFPVDIRNSINEMWSSYADNKQKMREELSTKPITLDALNNMLANVESMRTPLNRQYFNKIGRQLATDSSRNEVNSLLTDFFKGVMPTTMQGVVVPSGTKVSSMPEQQVSRPTIDEKRKSRPQPVSTETYESVSDDGITNRYEIITYENGTQKVKLYGQNPQTGEFELLSGNFLKFNKEEAENLSLEKKIEILGVTNEWRPVDTFTIDQQLNTSKEELKKKGEEIIKEAIEKDTQHMERADAAAFNRLTDIAQGRFTEESMEGQRDHMMLLANFLLKVLKKEEFAIWKAGPKSEWMKKFSGDFGNVASKFLYNKEFNTDMFNDAMYHMIINGQTFETSSDNVFLHELLHVATVPAFNRVMDPQKFGEPSQADIDFVQEIELITQEFNTRIKKSKKNLKDIYWPTQSELGPREFIANLSNPVFIKEAKKRKFGSSTILGKALEAIVRWLGLPTQTDSDVTFFNATVASLEKFYSTRMVERQHTEIPVSVETVEETAPEQSVERPELLEAINKIFKEDPQIQEYVSKFDNAKLTPTELLNLNNRLESLREDIEDGEVDLDDVIDELSGFFDEELNRAEELSRASNEPQNKLKGVHVMADAPSLVNKAARATFAEKFLGLTPVIAQKAGIRPDKGRWVDMIYEMLRNSIASPELNVMKKATKLAVQAATARKLEDETGGAIGQREPILKALVNYLWSDALQRTSEDTMYPSRNSLMNSLQAAFPEEFNYATSSDYTRALAEAMFEKPADRKYTNVSEVRKFVKNANSLINALSYKENDPLEGQPALSVAAHVSNLMDQSRLYISSDAEAITKDTKTVGFVLNNFETPTHYMMAKSWVMDTMYTLLQEATKPVRGRLVKSRQELLAEIQQRLIADTNTVSRKQEKRAEDLLKEGSLKALNKSWGNKPLLFYMLKTIYPDWDVVKIEEVEELIEQSEEFANRNDILQGIRKETEDSDLVDQESRLTDSVKEVLSFIKNPTYEGLGVWHPKRFLSNRHTFVAMMNFIFDHVGLNNLDEWAVQKKKHLDKMHKSIFSDVEDKLYTTIDDLQAQANFKVNPVVGNNLALEVQKDSLSTTRIAVIYDPQGNLMKEDGSQMSLAEAEEKLSRQKKQGLDKASRIEIVSRNMLPKEAFAIMQNLSPQISERMFNNMFLKSKAANTLRELANTFGSLTEKNYKIAEHENNFGTILTKYFNASGFGLDKSIYGAIRHVLEVYQDDKGLKGNFKVDPAITSIYKLAQKADKEAIREFLKFFKMADVADTLDLNRINSSSIYSKIMAFIDEANSVGQTEDLSKLFKKESSIFKELRKVIRYTEDQLRKKSVSDSKNNKLYTSVPKSWYYKVLEQFIKGSRTTALQGATGSNSFFGSKVMSYLKTPFFKQNPFVSGIQRIYSASEHDATKNTLTLKNVPFNRETEQFFYTRAFTHGFLDSIASSSATVRTYNQFTYQVADKSRMPMAEMRVLDYDELTKAAEGFVRQAMMQPDEFIKARQKAHKEGRHLNFTILDKVMDKLEGGAGKSYSPAQLAQQVVKELREEGKQFAQDFANSKAFVSSNIPLVLEKLIDGDNGASFASLKAARENLSLIKTVNPNKRSAEDTANIAKAITPLAELFYVNNYLNGYGLNQMLSGPFNYYKHTEDVVKRMSGVVGPGIYPLVNPDFGSARTFKVLVAEDRESKEETLRDLIDTLVEDENEKKQLEVFFELFESTDGQGFMTPARHADLQKGYGKAYNLGNVMKPMHFEVITQDRELEVVEADVVSQPYYQETIAKYDNLYGKNNYTKTTLEDGSVRFSVAEPIPVYLKYSSVVLSDDLVEKYPALGKIRTYLEDAGAGELVFGSVVKSAKTLSKVKLGDIYSHVRGQKVDVSGSMLELNNENYKMQFNPVAKVDKKVSIFTQLMYFINIMGTNKDSAQKAYSAVAYLMNDYLRAIEEELGTDSKIASRIREAMNNPGNELIRALLEAGIHPSNPTISRKAYTQLASLVENKVQKIKFRGSKLILQSEEGITKKDGSKLRFVKMPGGRYAAEVILPKNMLTQEQIRNIENGKDTYLLPDFFGYRIPSTEIHSAVPMKVVGTYDDKGTNVVIAPQELVYLHGSDFDVDSLFVIQRETMGTAESRILELEPNTPIGYIRDKDGKWKFDYKNDILREYLDKLDSRIAALERLKVSKELTVSVNRLSIINSEITRLEASKSKLKEAYTKNMIMDTMLETITDKKNRSRMNTPIVMSLFKDKDNPESVRSKLELYGAWPEDESRDLSKIQNSYVSLKSMKDGAVLTGAFANAIKVFSYMYTANTQGTPAEVKAELALEFDGMTYNKIEDKSFDGNLTWQYLDAAVNLAIDNLNEMILPKLGVNVTTGGAWSTMIGLGMDVTSATLLVKNPLIQKLGSVDYSNVDKALPQLAKEVLGDAYTAAFGEQAWNNLLETSKKPSKDVEIEGVLDRLYRDISSVFIGQNTLDDVQLNDEILSYLIHEDTDMLEHEAKKFDFPGATTDLKVALIKFKALHLYAKAHKLGEQARTLSDVLNVIRVNPGTPEKMDKFNDAFNAIFEVEEGTNLTSTDQTMDTTPMEYTPGQMKLAVKPTFGFNIPELLTNAPHIGKAITATKLTQNKISEVLFKFRQPTIDFAKEVLKDLDFIGFGLNRLEYTDILNELEHMLIASLYNDKIKGEQVYQRSNSSKLTNIAAFNHRLVDRLNALKIADEKAYTTSRDEGDGHYIRNKFLNSLVIEKRGYTVSIRMANVISPDLGEVALLREDFKRLGEFEETVNPSTGKSTFTHVPGRLRVDAAIQEDLLAFSVINSGFRFSATSYSAFVDPTLYKEVDKNFVKLFKKFSENKEMRAKMKPWFKIALAFKKADSLTSLPKTKIGEKGKEELHAIVTQGPIKAGTVGKFRGKEMIQTSEATVEEVFFDRKYINRLKGQSNSAVAEEYPEYAVLTNYPSADDTRGRTTYDLYQRITPQSLLKDSDHIYYQRLGRKSSTGYYVNSDTLDLKQPFDPKYRTITVPDVTKPTVFGYDKIEVGETIRLTTFDDAMRVDSVLAQVKEIKEIPSAIEGMTRYSYTVEYSKRPLAETVSRASVSNPYTVHDFLRDVTNTTNNLNCD